MVRHIMYGAITSMVIIFSLLLLSATHGGSSSSWDTTEHDDGGSFFLRTSETSTTAVENEISRTMSEEQSSIFHTEHDNKEEGRRGLDEQECKKCCTASGWVMIFGAVAIIGPWIIVGLLSILEPGICEAFWRVGAFMAACGLIGVIGGGIGAAVNGLHIKVDCDD